MAELDGRMPELDGLAAQDGAAARSLSLLLGALRAWRGAEASVVSALVERGFDGRQPLAEGVEPWTLGQGLRRADPERRGERAPTSSPSAARGGP